MRNVAGEDVGQGAHGEGGIVRDAASLPGLLRKVFEQGQARVARIAKVFNMVAPGNGIRRGGINANVLIEAGQGFLKSTGKPESPKRENALTIINVIEQFAHRPLIRRVSMKRFLFWDTAQEAEGWGQLRFHLIDDVVA